MEKYDLAIIGAGPGGLSATSKALELGAKVALIEKEKVGGTCLHKGCVPTKSLNKSAFSGELFEDAMKRKDKVITELEKQAKAIVKGADFYSGSAFLDSANNITIGNRDKIEANKIIISTGSYPIMPSKFDLDRKKVMTSDEIFSLDKKPDSILIVGGGYIGAEFAAIFSSYGVKVSIVELLPNLLSTEDDEAVKIALRYFKKNNVDIYTGIGLDSITINNKASSKLSDGRIIDADIILMAIGRAPNTKSLGLDKLLIDMAPKGAIRVNKAMETNVNGIYAIGDAIDRGLRLAHVAEKEGLIAAQNALGKQAKMDYSIIPTVVFTKPEIASVGKRESELKRDSYVVGKFWYKGNAMAHCSNETEGFAKVVVDKISHEVLGAVIVGSSSSELIHELSIAINAKTKVEDLADLVHFHPSKSEIIKKSAEIALKKL